MAAQRTCRWIMGLMATVAFPASAFAQVTLPAEPSPLSAVKRLFCGNFDGTTPQVLGGQVITPVSTNLVKAFEFQSTTFPSVSSAAGFTFTWAGGAPVASELYGPLFGERALTNGKGKLSATVNYQHLSWSSFDGQQIRADQDGLLWGDVNPNPPGTKTPSDQYRGVCKANINSDVVLLALNYGLARRVDISLGVPYVHTSVSGTSEFSPLGSQVFNNLPKTTYAVTGAASGIGDMSVALKVGLLESGSFHLAVRGGFGLGTGSASKMTGTGQRVLSGTAVATWETGPLSLHGQVGYSGATGKADPDGFGQVFNEYGYVLGLDVAAVPERVTLGSELVVRHLLDTPGFDVPTQTAQNKDLNVYFFSVGGKVRVVQRVLFTAYLLIPAGNSGLLPNKPSFNGGLNYVF